MKDKIELQTIIAQNITHYRKQLNMTQLELAEKLNYSDKSVSKWERAEGVPDIFVLKELAGFFNIKLDDLTSRHKIKPLAKKQTRMQSYFYASLSWALATIAFGILSLFRVEGNWWYLFIFAIPASTLTISIFNIVWNQKLNLLIHGSIFIWSLALSIFIILPLETRYMVFVMCIPIYILIVLLFFMIYRKKSKV